MVASKSTSVSHESSSSSESSAIDAGDFECNICFELAQDPVVTLCGHLFCWPCLYRWLHHHSHCQECPVCKAIVEEPKLVPLYGRGKTQVDPRSKFYPGIEIPNRPTGQRPETASPPPRQEGDNNPYYGFGMMGGLFPTATARIGNFTLSSAFVGLSLFPSLLNIQFHGFTDATVYGTTSGSPYAFHGFHSGGAHSTPRRMSGGRQTDNILKNLLLFIGALVILALICW